MASPTLALQRLQQQRFAQSPLVTPAEVVAWLGAVQAQDYQGAKWALGLRMQSAADEIVERAFAAGDILRTHVMRPTWHFVTPADIRWLLELTAPRVKVKLTTMDRQLELDKPLLLRSYRVITAALRQCKPLTRAELGSALAQRGITADGLRLTHIVMHAELDAVVCSGPRRGKQFTYMLLAERAPQARVLKRDEALAELTRRYYTGHGPATVRDFVWWSGLTVADAKLGLAMAAPHLAHDDIDGQTYWFSPSAQPFAGPGPAALLLPAYDEFLVGFDAFDRSRQAGRPAGESILFGSTLVIGGQVAGSWRRTFEKGKVVIELTPFAPLTVAEEDAVNAAAQRYGTFLGMPVIRRSGDGTDASEGQGIPPDA